MRLKLVVEYDGAGFAGWQRQPNVRSVQGELEQVLSELAGAPTRVRGAGRTDAGVHARGQVADADWSGRLSPAEVTSALNARLADDLVIVRAELVAPDFDARGDALSKRYLYRILNRRARGPTRRHRTWHVRGRLDVAHMRAAAASLAGSHDFESFRGARGGPPPEQSTCRTLDVLEVFRDGDEVRVRAEGRSFLRHMVRNLAGTLTEVGHGRLAPSEIPEILAARDRARAGPTAPAHGLCLESVRYPDA